MGKRLLAAVLICVVALFAATQTSFAEPREQRGQRGQHRGQHRGQREQQEAPSDLIGSFWGGVLGGFLWSQATRPDREAQDVEGEMEPWSEEWFNYCKRRFRSFDPETGKYLAFDGNHYFCK